MPPAQRSVKVEDLPGLVTREGDTLAAEDSLAVVLRWQIQEGTNLYGLGQRSGPLERTGLAASNWTTDNPVGHNRTTDPLYQAHPLLWGSTPHHRHPEKGPDSWWALLFCHTGYSRFDLAQASPKVLECLTLGPSVCFQFHAASSPEELFRSLSQTLSPPSRPPLWAFGFHQSRWGYRSGQEVSELIRSFREKKLPLDVVHLDIDHMDNYRSFSFDPERFREPKKQFAEWADDDVRVVTILDPGLKFDTSGDYQPVEQGLREGHFIRSKSGSPVVGYCWPDEALFPDFTREATRQWWSSLCQFYLESGVSGLWIDMNEPAIFDKPFWSGGSKQLPMPLTTPWGEDHKRLDHKTLRNIYGSTMSQATRSAWSERQTRPWVLTRSGFTGVGSVAWSWMGDNTSWWEHLALSFPQLSSMGLVNSGFVGVDIGGFFGHCSAELYSAWIEASVLYPFMRAHSALGTAEQHPWSFGPEVEKVAREALKLRYRLLPYIYTAAVAHCLGDKPILRPLFFDYPDDLRFRYTEDQVLFGPNIMACPFLQRGQSERLVQFPEGEWFDFYSGLKIDTDKSTVVSRRPGQVPLFVKGGAVIATLAREVQSTNEALGSPFELLHYPSNREVHSRLYWDDGDGWEFQQGQYLDLQLSNHKNELTVSKKHIHPVFEPIEMTLSRATPGGWSKRAYKPQ